MYTVHKHKYITTVQGHLDFIEKMVVEHYDNENYGNVLFLLNHIFLKEDILEFKKQYSKIIFYNLEHFSAQTYLAKSNQWRELLFLNLEACDEFWDFLIENKRYYTNNLIDRYKFMPLRYTDTKNVKNEKTIDVLFNGTADTNVRKTFICSLLNNYEDRKFNSVIVNAMFGDSLSKMLQKTKFVCDFPHYKLYGNTQNCARIFEALCHNIQVISYTDTNRVVNYFPGLIEIINPENGFDADKTQEIVLNYKERNVAEEYKNLTYSDSAYETYKTNISQIY